MIYNPDNENLSALQTPEGNSGEGGRVLVEARATASHRHRDKRLPVGDSARPSLLRFFQRAGLKPPAPSATPESVEPTHSERAAMLEISKLRRDAQGQPLQPTETLPGTGPIVRNSDGEIVSLEPGSLHHGARREACRQVELELRRSPITTDMGDFGDGSGDCAVRPVPAKVQAAAAVPLKLRYSENRGAWETDIKPEKKRAGGAR